MQAELAKKAGEYEILLYRGKLSDNAAQGSVQSESIQLIGRRNACFTNSRHFSAITH
jgi:hypothetical protein